MLNFFLSAEVAILYRQKKPKTFSTHQIASIIDTNGHAELEEYDIHGRGFSFSKTVDTIFIFVSVFLFLACIIFYVILNSNIKKQSLHEMLK
jgi:hypothetical protein